MNERSSRVPLNKQERFILSSLSQPITRKELLRRIQDTKKDPKNTIFPEYFGYNSFDSLIDGMANKGLIEEAFISTDQGRKELEDDQRRRTMPVSPVQFLVRPVERTREEQFRPAPLVRPTDVPRPKSEPKKEKKKLGLGDLKTIRGELPKE